jgi:hypothetical protein
VQIHKKNILETGKLYVQTFPTIQFNSFSDQAIHMLKGKAAQNYEAAFK